MLRCVGGGVQPKMVAVYGSFEEVEAARPKAGSYRKYAAAIAGAWAVLFVATVLIVGKLPAFEAPAGCCASVHRGNGVPRSAMFRSALRQLGDQRQLRVRDHGAGLDCAVLR